MPRLTRSFFARSALAVGPDLLGCRLVHELDARTRLEGIIVEVEAYLGDGSDPASHSDRGPTRRNATMFGAPGHFYVYRSMGLHHCANLVCEPASAVLLRAVEPLRGEPRMRRLRSGRDGRDLTNGPGKLAQAFGIALLHDGVDALHGPLRIEPRRADPGPIRAGPRVGISRATALPYRFWIAGHPCVTRTPLNR